MPSGSVLSEFKTDFSINGLIYFASQGISACLPQFHSYGARE
jgi:hypothetical protein